MNLKNKKAEDRYVSIWTFIIMGAVIVALVMGVLMILSVKLDVRNIEADTLASKIIDCLNEDFDYSKIIAKDFNVYEKCRFHREVLDSAIYYFNIKLTGVSDSSEYSLEGGNTDFRVQCEYQELENRVEIKLAACSQKSALIEDVKAGKIYKINVMAASNQVAI